MNKQERWKKTWRCMYLVRINYRTLKAYDGGQPLPAAQRGKMLYLHRWLLLAGQVCSALKSRSGKSPARARHDWLMAHALELTFLSPVKPDRLRAQMSGGRRPVTSAYAQNMLDAAMRTLQAAAEESGLLDSAGGSIAPPLR